MPLPTPKKGETRQAFVERFMKSNAAKEFPTQKQRFAVAYQNNIAVKRNKQTPGNHETDYRGFVDGGGPSREVEIGWVRRI